MDSGKMKYKYFFIMRHGERADWGGEKPIREGDSQLTSRGHEQAYLTGEYIKKVSFYIIIPTSSFSHSLSVTLKLTQTVNILCQFIQLIIAQLKIISSPCARTVQTAGQVCKAIGLSDITIHNGMCDTYNKMDMPLKLKQLELQ